jgi:endonuclease/exonuclease/phosphatase (EEP) superfamily protein YafD
VNLHATLFRGPIRAVEEIEHILAGVQNDAGPMIFAGDFNTVSIAFFDAINKKMEAYGLLHLPIRNDPRPLSQQLDHIFYRGLDPVEVNVEAKVTSSDHLPLTARFNLR